MAVDEINHHPEFDFSIHAACPRSPRHHHRISYGLRRSHPQRRRRAHRRLLHVGIAQAGAADRRAHRSPAVVSRALRGIRMFRQCHLCRRITQSQRAAARPLRARQSLAGGFLRRLQLCLDLGDQSRHAGVGERRHRATFLPNGCSNWARARSATSSTRSFAASRRSSSTRWSAVRATISSAPSTPPQGRRSRHSDAELQPVRAGTHDRRTGVCRLHHVVGLFREHPPAREPRIRRSAGRRVTATTAAPPSTGNLPMSRSICWRARCRALAPRISARCGVPRPAIATIRRKDRCGSTVATIIAFLRRACGLQSARTV